MDGQLRGSEHSEGGGGGKNRTLGVSLSQPPSSRGSCCMLTPPDTGGSGHQRFARRHFPHPYWVVTARAERKKRHFKEGRI